MTKLIIYIVYLTMVKVNILKLIMAEIPKKKLTEIKTNHN